jgi:putative peptidoglycan lipid II flippase
MNRLLNRANKRVSFGNAATLLIVVALVGQVLGFFRNRLISTNFTQVDPGSTDAFFAAFQIPDFFFMTIAAGALGVVFVPVLADRLQGGDKKGAWEVTNSLLNMLSIIMFAVGVVVFVLAEPLLHGIYPRLNPHQLDQATTIMRIIALNPLLFTLSGVITSVQQTLGRFFFFAIAPLFYNAAIIVSVYVFKGTAFGVKGLGVGALAGAILQLLVAALGMWGLKYRYSHKINVKTEDFKTIIRQLPARSIDQGVDSINTTVEINRGIALGQGPATYYTYATTLQNVPVMLFGTSIATAAFPRLADRLAQKRPDLFHRDFFRVLRIMVWISMPVVVVSYFCRGYLARLLYGDVAPTVALIFGYLTGAIFFRIITTLLTRYFYVQKDTKTPLVVSLLTIALNIVLVFNLARPTAYGVVGLALAQSIATGFKVILLGAIMLWRDPALFNARFWGAIMRILSVTGFSVIAAYLVAHALPLQVTDRGLVTLGVKFAFIAGVTLLVHTGISALFGLEEAQAVLGKMRRMGKRLVSKPVRIE